MIPFRTPGQQSFAQNASSCTMVSNPNKTPTLFPLVLVDGQSDVKLIPCTTLISVQYLSRLVHLEPW